MKIYDFQAFPHKIALKVDSNYINSGDLQGVETKGEVEIVNNLQRVPKTWAKHKLLPNQTVNRIQRILFQLHNRTFNLNLNKNNISL